MKRLQIVLLVLILTSTHLFAQRGSNSRNVEVASNRVDQQELRRFEQVLDQFSYAMMTNNIRASRYAKHEILLVMEREINQSKVKLRMLQHQNAVTTYSKREPDWRIPRMESRGRGLAQNQHIKVAEVVHRLEKQERLYVRFNNLDLQRTGNRIINEDDHRKLMYRFKETMREDLLEDVAQANRNATANRRMN